MSSPYSGATPASSTQSIPTTQSIPAAGYTDPAQQNYAADYSGGMGTPTTEAGRPDVEGTSVGQLLGEVSKDLSTLMRQELELAKAELKVEAKKAGQGAGMFGAAGFAGYMVLLFLSITLLWALDNVMDTSLAALIVALLWAVIGAVLFVVGRAQLKKLRGPEQTIETVKEVPPALKPNPGR